MTTSKEGIKVTGHVELVIHREGQPDELWKYQNLVVDAGKDLIASRMTDNNDNAPSHLACGSSDQVAAESDTALVGTEHVRAAATVSHSSNTVTISATLTMTATVSVSEYGIFNAASAGTMLARFVASTISLDNGDSIDVTWTLQFGD